MRLATALAMVLAACAATAHAQDTPPVPALTVGGSEWMVTAGPAFGIAIFHSAKGHRYVWPALSWGRILTRPVGPRLLRGQFQWSLEAVPLFGQYQPDRTLGIGVTPLLWRWNFTPHGKLAPFAELAGGALWTRAPVPSGTTTANFTAHVGYGVRYLLRPRAALVAAYRFHHISNGNRLEKNPGVNAHLLQVGVSVVR